MPLHGLSGWFDPVGFYYEGSAGVHVIALRFPPVLSVEIAQLLTLCRQQNRSLRGIECDLT